MRKMPASRSIDRIGPVPLWVVYAAILVLDLLIIAALVTAVTWAGDRIEDAIWPGGSEWVHF